MISDLHEYRREVRLPRHLPLSATFTSGELKPTTTFEEHAAEFTVGPRVSEVEDERVLLAKLVLPANAPGLDPEKHAIEVWWKEVAHEQVCVTIPPVAKSSRTSWGSMLVEVRVEGAGRRVRR